MLNFEDIKFFKLNIEKRMFLKKFLISLIIMVIFGGICFAETVVFNTKTLKYHKPTCQYAKKCTVNCIKIDKQQARQKNGKPCKVCGG